MRELDFLPPAYKQARRQRRTMLLQCYGAILLGLAILAGTMLPAVFTHSRTVSSHKAAEPRRASTQPAESLSPSSLDDTTATIDAPSGQ